MNINTYYILFDIYIQNLSRQTGKYEDCIDIIYAYYANMTNYQLDCAEHMYLIIGYRNRYSIIIDPDIYLCQNKLLLFEQKYM